VLGIVLIFGYLLKEGSENGIFFATFWWPHGALWAKQQQNKQS